MINYSWIIPQDAFEVYPSEDGLTNVVKYIKWIRKAEEIDGDITYSAQNNATFICGQPDPSNYTPYEYLTEEIVISWLESGLNMQTIDGALANNIANQMLPKTEVLPNPF
jgi:hypothetical protein